MGVRILVDADACLVKDEVYKVAYRLNVPVSIVSNSHLRVPQHPLIERVVVSDGFDAADDWIAERADARSVVVTADILLADRCLRPARRFSLRPASPSPPPRSARRWRPARSWPTCAPAATSSEGPRRSQKPTVRASSRRSTRRW